MKKFIPFLVSFALIALSPVLDAQKTYKAVCDRSDGTVKFLMAIVPMTAQTPGENLYCPGMTCGAFRFD